MDVHARRDLLGCQSNPEEKQEYLVSFSGDLRLSNDQLFQVRLTYVPDLFVLDATTFQPYLDIVGRVDDSTPERSGKLILEDINNQLVPRWIRVTIFGRLDQSDMHTYRCLFQDHQPNWQNSSLISAVRDFELN